MRFNLKELSTTDEEQVKAARETKERAKSGQAAQANGSSRTLGEDHTPPAEATEVPSSKPTQDEEPGADTANGNADAQDVDDGQAAAQKQGAQNNTTEA